MSRYSLTPHIALREAARELEPRYSLLWQWRHRVEQWRDELRSRLCELLGFPREPCELEVRELETADDDTFSRTKIVYDVEYGVSAAAWVCVPHGNENPLPAVVCAHPRGPGKDELVGLVGCAPGSDFAITLARRGYVTVAPDARCFGERRAHEEGLSLAGSLLGRPLVGMQVWDLLVAARYARSRPDVNAGRVGLAGMGMGAVPAIMAAAVDEELAGTVACGGLSTFRELVVSRDCFSDGGAAEGLVPGLLGYADLDDIACLVAPRPLALLQGRGDETVPPRGAQELLERTRAGFQLMGEGVKLEAQLLDAGYGFHTEPACAFLDSWLKLPVPGE